MCTGSAPSVTPPPPPPPPPPIAPAEVPTVNIGAKQSEAGKKRRKIKRTDLRNPIGGKVPSGLGST